MEKSKGFVAMGSLSPTPRAEQNTAPPDKYDNSGLQMDQLFQEIQFTPNTFCALRNTTKI